MTYQVAPGVTNNDSFGYENVIRKRKKFHVEQMKEEMDSFLSEITANGGHPVGPFFYSLNNMPDNTELDIEFFLPIAEDYLDIPGTVFSSYFEVNNLILIEIDNQYDTQTEAAYNSLLWTLDVNNKEVNTPFYHVYDDDIKNTGKVTIFVGYAY